MATAGSVRSDAVDGIAVLTLDSPPVNALSRAVRASLIEALNTAQSDPAIRAVVVTGGGRGFSGGANITEFDKPPASPTLQDVLAALDDAPKPVIAAVHGIALGGGLELTLACRYRMAAAGAKVGLPEVKIGLLPGGGGTQRLPRLVGVEAALEMITSGEPVDAEIARASGLIDEVVTGDLRAAAIDRARTLVAAPPLRTRDRDERLAPARADPGLFDRFRAANARRFRNVTAPGNCLEAVRAAVDLPFDAGIVRERELFMELVAGPQSKALRYAFFAERAAAKIPDIADDTPTRPIARVGVIGAGTMGGGIAMNFLNAGVPVTIVEAKPENLARGQATIQRNYDNTAKRGRLTAADVERRMALLTGGLELDALADCDLIIEAVFEEMDVKKAVFTRLDAIAKPGAILASNTSYLDIDAIAAVTSRPQDVIGLHFFSPANVMRLLEVVRGSKTDPGVIATSMQLARKIGKVAVLVRVCHGFVGNRMLEARQVEANKLILEGALPWEVDRVLTDFGLPMGPFAMADLAGLDLGWTRERSTGSSVRELLCEQGRFGQKTNGGFYDYDADRKATPSAAAEAAILEISRRQGVVRRSIDASEILERCVYPMINEGAKILAEGIASRASDVDVVWINGYGWPAWRGGPMFYADTLGARVIFDRLRAFEATGGPVYAPAPLLARLAADNGRFQDL